ncbi:MAG: NEAT domain-containing protein, partial [Coriobacteriia bacterium]|nr:NEAT domain-containing protein [Coriobacteriia bacterium]
HVDKVVGHMGSGLAGAPLGVFMVIDPTTAQEIAAPLFSGFGDGGGVDKSQLEMRITYAENLDEADYTITSFGAMLIELANAQGVFANELATQADISSALQSLNQAITSLVNISALKVRVADAEQLTLTDYTDETAAALSVALSAAHAVLGNASASTGDVAAALAALNAAISGLVSKSLNFPTVGSFYLLDVKMKMTDDLNQVSSANVFYDDRAVVEVVNENQFRVSFFQTSGINLVQDNSYAYDKTQSDSNAIALHLDNRVSATETSNSAGTITRVTVEMQSATRTLLVVYSINMGTEQNPNWASRDMRMELSLAGAQEMTVLEYLGFDFTGGVIITPPAAVDKTALKALIDQALQVDASLYTELSYNTLRNALNEAQSVYANANASQASVDAARMQLQAALDGLVLKPTDAVSIETSGDGRYTVRVDFWHASSDEPSMANASLNKTAIIDVNGGNITMSISTVPIQSGSLVTALTVFTVYGSPAGVIANNITIGGSSYPSAFSFGLPNRNTYHPVTFTMRPDIQVMPDGLGGRLRISWDTLQAADGAVLSSNTAIASVDKDVSDVERTALEAEEEAKTPVLSSSSNSSGNSSTTLGEQETPAGLEAVAEGFLDFLAGIPWYGWTGVTLGVLGAGAVAFNLHRVRSASKLVSLAESAKTGEPV